MTEILNDFFNLTGIDTSTPLTFPDLIVWFVCVMVALMLVLAVWRFFSEIVTSVVSIFSNK